MAKAADMDEKLRRQTARRSISSAEKIVFRIQKVDGKAAYYWEVEYENGEIFARSKIFRSGKKCEESLHVINDSCKEGTVRAYRGGRSILM